MFYYYLNQLAYFAEKVLSLRRGLRRLISELKKTTLTSPYAQVSKCYALVMIINNMNPFDWVLLL